MWGGRFAQGPDEVFRRANDSLPIDWRLVQQDIRGSVAWAGALADAGVLTDAEKDQITHALNAIAQDAASIDTPPTDSGAEDVHTWVEWELIKHVGDLGKKLHTGRSRNDQVATDFRLWAMSFCDEARRAVAGLASVLSQRALEHHADPYPAYTHLQLAQPVTFGHVCLAYTEMLERDLDRLEDARKRTAVCPLGSAALAGTAYPVDRGALAQKLGFDRPSNNSLDAVSDRDFVIEILSVLSTLAMHLSRLAEDLIIGATAEFNLVRLDDGVTSGSSLMPQKRNPDSLEIIRGACGSIIGAHVSLLVTCKGLPLAYNKDLQFDKKPLFEAADLAMTVLILAKRTMEGLTLNTEVARARALAGYAAATDIADLLVKAGVPFREAHEQVGQLVRLAESRSISLEEIPEGDLKEIAPKLDPESLRALTLESILNARNVKGGTAPERVRAEAEAAFSRLNQLS